MSDLSARKAPVITVSSEAKSKKLDKTKEKISSVKKEGKISVGTKPLSSEVKSEFAVREGGSLKKLRISSSTSVEKEPALKPDTVIPSVKGNRKEGKFEPLPQKTQMAAPRRISPVLSEDSKIEVPRVDVALKATEKNNEEKETDILPDLSTYRLSSVIAAGLTGAWLLVAAIYAFFYLGAGEVFSQQPHILGGFLAGILAPVALLWMIVAHIQRGGEVKEYASILRSELKALEFSNKEVTKSSQSIDLTEESKSTLNSIHKARAGLRSEIKYLSSVSEKTGAQLEKLNSTLSERASNLLDMTQEIKKRTESLQKVAVSKLSNEAVSKTTPAETASTILAKTDGLTEKMEERVKSLNAVLGKMEGTLGNIESKGAGTADKLSKAVQDSSSNVHALENIISKSIEKLTKATDDAKVKTEGLIEKSSEKVIELNKSGEKASQTITSVLDLIDSSREKIEKTSKVMDEQVEKTAKSVEDQTSNITKVQENLSKRIDEMQTQISEPLAAVNRAVDKAVGKHGEMGEALDKRIEALNEVSDKAAQRTEDIRDGLRSQTQEMATLMGQIAGHSRSVKAMLQDENDNLAENIKSALDKVSSVGESLRGESEKLEGITANAEERIGKIGEALSKHAMNAVKNTGNIITDFKTIESVLSDNVKSLVEQSVEAKGAVGDIASDIQKSADIIEPIYTEAVDKIDRTQERLDKMASGFEEKTNSNINKLKSFETLFDERLKTLSSSAEDAAHILERSSNNLGDRVNDIDNATLSAQEKLQNIDTLFKNHVSDIHLTTDQALLKIDNIQKAMNTHYQDLSASVAESMAQMQDVGQQFVKQTEQVQKLSVEAVGGLDKAGNKANEKIKGLNKLAQGTAQQMEGMLQKVQKEAEHLLKTSSITLEQMKKTGEDFAERAKLVEEQMQGSVQSTKKYGEELDKQVGKVSKTSKRSAEDIEKAMAQLAEKLLDVKQVSKDVTGEVFSSRDKLSSETEHLADVSLKAARVVEEAASSYVRQSGALSKATAKAANHIDKVREGDWRVQRDSFLNATRFILESLHSLSVDLTRMVDGDIQEKVWKAYQKGDIAVFTRRLIENRDKLPLDKMKGKYMEDNEFRTYVNRFIRQFEDVYEQAGTNDYGELISATFASSDVGGLYDILCGVAGRKSLVKKLGRRAA